MIEKSLQDSDLETESGEELNADEKDDEIPCLLRELNETAIFALHNEDTQNALECLKRAE
jgi:hypothetical protein